VAIRSSGEEYGSSQAEVQTMLVSTPALSEKACSHTTVAMSSLFSLSVCERDTHKISAAKANPHIRRYRKRRRRVSGTTNSWGSWEAHRPIVWFFPAAVVEVRSSAHLRSASPIMNDSLPSAALSSIDCNTGLAGNGIKAAHAPSLFLYPGCHRSCDGCMRVVLLRCES